MWPGRFRYIYFVFLVVQSGPLNKTRPLQVLMKKSAVQDNESHHSPPLVYIVLITLDCDVMVTCFISEKGIEGSVSFPKISLVMIQLGGHLLPLTGSILTSFPAFLHFWDAN